MAKTREELVLQVVGTGRLDNRPADDPKLQEVVRALRRKRKERSRETSGRR